MVLIDSNFTANTMLNEDTSAEGRATGGGVSIQWSANSNVKGVSTYVRRCSFHGNRIETKGLLAEFGGLAVVHRGAVGRAVFSMLSCSFKGNILTAATAPFGGGPQCKGGGGGLNFEDDTSGTTVEVRDCHFDENQLTTGGVAIGGGLAIQYKRSSYDLRLIMTGIAVVIRWAVCVIL